jgi:hypothetical protein
MLAPKLHYKSERITSMCFIRVVIYELFIKAPCDSNCCYKEKSKEQKDPLVLFPERIILFGDEEADEEVWPFRSACFVVVVVAVDKRVFAPPVTRALFSFFSLSDVTH